MTHQKETLINWKFNPITGKPNERDRYASENYGYYNGVRPDSFQEKQEINEAKLQALTERVRWRNTRKIKNYRFTGTIPNPKQASDYIPWLYDEE